MAEEDEQRDGDLQPPEGVMPPGGFDIAGEGENICEVCGGDGKVDGGSCPECGGSGRVKEKIAGG